MNARATEAERQVRDARSGGSLLILAVVAVMVASVLVVSASMTVRSRSVRMQEQRRLREWRREAANAASRSLADRVAADTNGWDALAEPWSAEPWELRQAGWILRVSGQGWQSVAGATVGMQDEERWISLNHADEALLRMLFERLGGLTGAAAERAAGQVGAWRAPPGTRTGEASSAPASAAVSFACPEQLGLVPGLLPETVARVREWVTAYGCGRVNINTAGDEVLGCVLLCAAAGDVAAALRLQDRIRDFRGTGGAFRQATAAAIGRDLGQVPPDEAALLARAEAYLGVESTAFSGIAEALPAAAVGAGRPPARLAFVWDRQTGAFVRRVWE